MHPELMPLRRIDELDRLLLESTKRPLLLFKHSASCGISAEALDQLIDHLNASGASVELQEAAARYAMVTVQTHREVSNEVAARLGVRHETPQALVIRDGRVVWAASHFRVTANAVKAALTQALGTA